MSRLTRLIAIATLAIGNAVYGASDGDKDFIAAYKTSFMDSCIESSGGDAFKPVCQCVLDELLANLSTEALQDPAKVSEFTQNIALKKCQK